VLDVEGKIYSYSEDDLVEFVVSRNFPNSVVSHLYVMASSLAG
jgi:hypothetical protein